MTKPNLSWPLFAAIGALGLAGALLAPACTVSSGDDDDVGVDAGKGGSSSAGGSKSTGGSAGAATGGSAGAATGGSGGSGGSTGGSGGSTGGSGGSAQMLACDGTEVIPLVSCDPSAQEPGSCNECIETNCCDEWKECAANDTTAGDFVCGWGGPDGTGEIGCIVACMQDGTSTIEDCAGGCAAEGCDGTITLATNALVDCMTAAETTCEEVCWPTQ